MPYAKSECKKCKGVSVIKFHSKANSNFYSNFSTSLCFSMKILDTLQHTSLMKGILSSSSSYLEANNMQEIAKVFIC